MKRELWRIEDVLAGLSGSKENYRVTIDSVQNPGVSARHHTEPPINPRCEQLFTLRVCDCVCVCVCLPSLSCPPSREETGAF